jgi:hypothetical protein
VHSSWATVVAHYKKYGPCFPPAPSLQPAHAQQDHSQHGHSWDRAAVVLKRAGRLFSRGNRPFPATSLIGPDLTLSLSLSPALPPPSFVLLRRPARAIEFFWGGKKASSFDFSLEIWVKFCSFLAPGGGTMTGKKIQVVRPA